MMLKNRWRLLATKWLSSAVRVVYRFRDIAKYFRAWRTVPEFRHSDELSGADKTYRIGWNFFETTWTFYLPNLGLEQ